MNKYLIALLGIVFLLEQAIIGSLVFDGYDQIQKIKTIVKQIEHESSKQKNSIKSVKDTIKIKNANLQQQITAQSKKTVTLVKNVEKKIGSPISKADLSMIVKEWSPRVVKIVCNYSRGSISGSGTASIIGNELYVFTNSHVVSNNGYAPNACDVKFLDGQIIPVSGSQTRVRNDVDWGGIIVKTDKIKLPFLEPCSSSPLIGDQIVVLGYPGIGSQNGITVTEGIISGIEQDYFVTSAKVEHGNSGGAAILVKDDCYLGPPSYGQSGTVESLSRILNVRVMF